MKKTVLAIIGSLVILAAVGCNACTGHSRFSVADSLAECPQAQNGSAYYGEKEFATYTEYKFSGASVLPSYCRVYK